VSFYLQTADQRRKLRITKAIKDSATKAALPQTVARNAWSWARIRGWLRSRPLLVPIAAIIIIAVVIVAVWVNRQQRVGGQSVIEQELAQLNTPASLREVPAQMVSVDLSPVAVRDVKPQVDVKLRGGATRIVEIHLPWIQKERYSKFQAEIRRVGESEGLTIHNLRAENAGQFAVRLRLPARILRPGDYQIQLAGIGADGAVNPSEEYTFRVVN